MKYSAGILPFRKRQQQYQVFLIHPGGPFWRNKDLGAWSVAKGEYIPSVETAESAARREFEEETGFHLDAVTLIELPKVITTSRKEIIVFAAECSFDASALLSNQFELEWPPQSVRFISVPEADKAAWFTISEASEKIHLSQLPLLQHLQEICKTTL